MSDDFTQEYVDEWRELARPLEELTGIKHNAFDPGVVFYHEGQSADLPRWLLELINKGLARQIDNNGNYILDNLLTSLRELKHADLENGVHVQLATAIAGQIAKDKAGAFTKDTLVEAYNDALDRIKLLEFRLAGIKIWVGDAFMSAREAKWKGESGENALAKALDFINGDNDGQR